MWNDVLQNPEREWSPRSKRWYLKEQKGPRPEEKREGAPDRRNYISKGARAGTNELCSGNNNRGIWLVQEFTRGSNWRVTLESQGGAGWRRPWVPSRGVIQQAKKKKVLAGLARKVGGWHDPGGVLKKFIWHQCAGRKRLKAGNWL